MEKQSRQRVQSLDRVVAILRCFGARSTHLGVTEISRSTDLSTSTVHRLLGAMTENGLVHQGRDQRYSMGPLIVQLARNGALPTTLQQAALPIMRRLRDEVDETVGLHQLLPSGYRAVIDQVESLQALRRSYTEFGVPLPLPHGTPGRAILAFLPLSQQQWWLNQDLPDSTTVTPVDPDAVWRDIEITRSTGWARPMGERTPGIRGIAAPLFDHSESPIGALSFSVPTVRMSTERENTLGALVAAAAWELSQTLGASERCRPSD